MRVLTTSTLSSTDKSVAAVCPAGKRVLGVGGGVVSSDGQVLLDGLRPAADLTRVTVNALEDDTGYTSNWGLTAYAICAAPVAGLERVSATSVIDSDGPKVHQLACPATKRVLSAGGEISSPNGQVVLDAIFPTADLVAGHRRLGGPQRQPAPGASRPTRSAGHGASASYAGVCLGLHGRVGSQALTGIAPTARRRRLRHGVARSRRRSSAG